MALTKVSRGLLSTGIVDNSTTTAITIDSSENVGIGTSSPRSVTNYSVVGINGTSGSAIDFELGEALKTSLTQSAGQFEINVVPALPLIFKTSNTERMRIDAAGRVTMPYQPAFAVRPAIGQDNIAVSADTTVVFGTEIADQGGNFASNTFTAPVTGLYQLNATVYFLEVQTASAFIQVNINTSNRVNYAVLDPASYDENSTYLTIGHSVLADMDAGDTAFVQVQMGPGGSASTDITVNSQFSGYLVA